MTSASARFAVDPNDDYPLLTLPGESQFKQETFNLWVYDSKLEMGLTSQFAATDDLSQFRCDVVLFTKNGTYRRLSRGDGARRDGPGAGNVFATNLAPLKHWRYELLGMLDRQGESAAGMPASALAAYQLDVVTISPPVEVGSQGDRGMTPSSGTMPRVALRYEQLCRARGPLRIEGETFAFDALGVRSHRRNSASIYASGAVGHTWISCLFPSGRGFHLLARRREPDGEVGFCYANYFDGLAYHEAEVVACPHFSGTETDEPFEAVIEVAGARISIAGESSAPQMSMVSNETIFSDRKIEIRASRAAGRFLLEGENGGGVIERSLRADKTPGGYYRRGEAA